MTIHTKPDWRESFCCGRLMQRKQNLHRKRGYRKRNANAFHFQKVNSVRKIQQSIQNALFVLTYSFVNFVVKHNSSYPLSLKIMIRHFAKAR